MSNYRFPTDLCIEGASAELIGAIRKARELESRLLGFQHLRAALLEILEIPGDPLKLPKTKDYLEEVERKIEVLKKEISGQT
jgi:hypothetical protein